jgi:hypothetical protein
MKKILLILLLSTAALAKDNKEPDIWYPGSAGTAVWDHNSKGEYIGYYIPRVEPNNTYAFYYHKGKYSPITVPGAEATIALKITPHGMVFGFYFDQETGYYGSFSWYKGHTYY